MKLDRNKYLESRSLKPITILVSVLIMNAILGAIVFLFPSEGILIGDLNLTFATAKDLQSQKDSIPAKIELEKVLEGINPIENLSDQDKKNFALSRRINDEVRAASFYDTTLNKVVVNQSRSIQLPPNNPTCLEHLIDALYSEAQHKVVRIVHYGDSQLEGDRITDYFRNRMQSLFGGKGPGIVLPNEPAASARRSAYVMQSKNIEKKAVYKKGGHANGHVYGIGCSSFIISGKQGKIVDLQDSTNKKAQDSVKAIGANTPTFIKVNNGSKAFALAKEYQSIGLLYRSNDLFKVRLTSDNYVNEYVLPAAKNGGVKRWNIPTQKSTKIEFINGVFPEVHGIALDDTVGVAVDNFPMRGSAAIGFSAMDRAVYKKQCQDLNVRCILLQYGINVVPTVRSDYSYYQKILVKQLVAIKAANPNASIIVIGPSDMSRNRKGVRQSYTNIPLIRDAMRNAAFETGCAFWDLYEAMGGQNSMVTWVDQGLAQKDYTHFSSKGASFVGELLYEAILEQVHLKHPTIIVQ